MRSRLFVAAFAVAAVAVGAAIIPACTTSEIATTGDIPVTETAPSPESSTTTTTVDPAVIVYASAVHDARVAAFLDAWRTSEALAFVAAWDRAENARRAAVAASRPQPSTTVPQRARGANVAPTATRSTGAPSGGCAIPSYICQRESRGSYTAVNGSSSAGGKYQFLPSTWNATARAMGRPDLVGVHPSQASPSDQDAMAAWLWRQPGGCAHWSAC